MTVCPSKEVITSPATRPALAAGVFAMTLAMVTPFAVLVGGSPVIPPIVFEESAATSMPRIAVSPMCTVVDASPFSIFFAISKAPY